MGREEFLLVVVLLVAVLGAMGVHQLGRKPDVEPVVIQSVERPLVILAKTPTPRPTRVSAIVYTPIPIAPHTQQGEDQALLQAINRATLLDFQQVPGIGKTISAAIVDYRDRNGAFQSVNDLEKVSGIGESRLEKIKEYFGGADRRPASMGPPAIPEFSQVSESNSSAPQRRQGVQGAPVPQSYVRVDINRATEEQLEEHLYGIGPALARRIVEYRNRHGGFRSVEELREVRGIGEKTLEKIRPHVRVD